MDWGKICNSYQGKLTGFIPHVNNLYNLFELSVWWEMGVGKSFQGHSVGKESACNVGDTGDKTSIPGLGRSPGVAWQPTLGFLPRIPWKKEPGGLQSIGSWRVRHDWSNWSTGMQYSDLVLRFWKTWYLKGWEWMGFPKEGKVDINSKPSLFPLSQKMIKTNKLRFVKACGFPLNFLISLSKWPHKISRVGSILVHFFKK